MWIFFFTSHPLFPKGCAQHWGGFSASWWWAWAKWNGCRLAWVCRGPWSQGVNCSSQSESSACPGWWLDVNMNSFKKQSNKEKQPQAFFYPGLFWCHCAEGMERLCPFSAISLSCKSTCIVSKPLSTHVGTLVGQPGPCLIWGRNLVWCVMSLKWCWVVVMPRGRHRACSGDLWWFPSAWLTQPLLQRLAMAMPPNWACRSFRQWPIPSGKSFVVKVPVKV